MEVFKNQLLVILLVGAAVLLVVAVYKKVLAKMVETNAPGDIPKVFPAENTDDVQHVVTDDVQEDIPNVPDANNKPTRMRPVIRARDEALKKDRQEGE